MAKKPLFTEGAAGCAYTNIMSAKNEYTAAAKKLCEELWDVYEPYADAEFLVEIRSNFDERFWEMYLTVTLKSEGFEISCPKPGPDVGILVEGQRIWFEAVTPSRGADGQPDQVPEMLNNGKVQSVPNEKLILRYLNSISEKYERQFPLWIKQKIVSEKDSLIISINPCRLGFDYADTIPPRILQVAFPVGNAFVRIDRDTLKTIEAGYEIRANIKKSSGSLVDTGVFLHEGYDKLSGLLVSRVDAVNRAKPLGQDFQLLANPVAKAPLPKKFRLSGTYFDVQENSDGYSVTPQSK